MPRQPSVPSSAGSAMSLGQLLRADGHPQRRDEALRRDQVVEHFYLAGGACAARC